MTLYSYFRSSCSYRVRIALNLKGIDYEYVPVHLLKDGGEHQKEDYLVKNPMGQVPFLVDGESGISQSMAIIYYLDKKVPSPQLFPDEAEASARVIELCEVINSGIQPIQNLKVMNEIGVLFGADQEAKTKWSHDWIERGFRAFENLVEKTAGKYCFGDQITAADLFLIPQYYNAVRFKVNMNQFTTIERISKLCLDHPEFKKSHPDYQPDAPK